MGVIKWLSELLTPPEPVPEPGPLQDRIEALAARWDVTSATAWYLARTYAVQHGVSFDAAVTTLEELSFDEAKIEAGEA